jgi:hypothetical protein
LDEKAVQVLHDRVEVGAEGVDVELNDSRVDGIGNTVQHAPSEADLGEARRGCVRLIDLHAQVEAK